MAGSQEVLQEYLVSLGFRTDQISLRKFEDGLGVTGKRILKVGTAVAGVALAVEAAASAFAYSMRKVYFQSELANTSVKNLKAMGFAGKQFGIEAEAMGSAIHGMAQELRLSPGKVGLLSSLTGIKQEGRQAADQVLDLVKATKSMPEYIGAQYAAQYGMDADTYHQLRNHYDEIIAKRSKLINMYKEIGYNPDDPAVKAHVLEYTESMDRLAVKFEFLGHAFLSSPIFSTGARTMETLLDGWTSWFTKDFLNPGEGTNGAWVLGMLGLGKKKSAAPAAPFKPTMEFAPGATTKKFDSSQLPGKQNLRPSLAGKIDANATIRKLEAYGWTREQAIGIAANLQRESQFSHTAVGDKGRAYGIAQWHPDRQASFKRWSGKDIRNSSYDEQLAFLNYEMRHGSEKSVGRALAKARTKEEAAGIVSRQYERPANADAEASIRASYATRLGQNYNERPINVAQNTTININAAGAEETGKAVGKAVDHSNAQVVRNFKGAVQ